MGFESLNSGTLYRINRARVQQLILYNVPEFNGSSPIGEANSSAEAEMGQLVDSSTGWPEEITGSSQSFILERLGKLVPRHDRPRPLRITFANEVQKHGSLKCSKEFRAAGIRPDDDLTKSQQKQRNDLSGDFQLLKRGYRPYFRGSRLPTTPKQDKHMHEGPGKQGYTTSVNCQQFNTNTPLCRAF